MRLGWFGGRGGSRFQGRDTTEQFICFIILLFMSMRKEGQVRRSDPIVPVEQRECTDCSCLIIFFTLVGVLFAIGVYSWFAGSFSKMTTAYDPDGKGCGSDYPEYPYIYFASPHSDSLWVTVCVKTCPKKGDTFIICQPNSVVKACTAVANAGDNTKAVEIYDSSVTAKTVCLPTSDTLRGQIGQAFGASSGAMTSLLKNTSLIFICLPIAIVLAVLFMLLIRFTASFFIYIMVAVAVLALVGLGLYLLIAPTSSATGSNSGITGTIIAAVVCFGLAILIVVLVVCYRHRISLATSIIKVAANFVSSNCLIVLLPIILFVITVAFLVLWFFQAVGFYSLGTPTTAERQYPFQHFQVTAAMKVLFVFHVFYLIWTLMFFIETNTFIIGGTATSWYYHNESPYGDATKRYLKKHIGSVIFGGLMIALLGLARMIYEAIMPHDQDVASSILRKCCDCVCCCCTKIFDWFASGAYTVINIRGTNFCSSGSEAFSMRLANFATSSVVAIVQAIFTLLVRLGITFLTVLIVYIIIKSTKTYGDDVTDSTLILIVVGVIAFTISCFFVSVYSDAIDAIYMTYLIDRERGDSGDNCPPELKDFLDDAEKNQNQYNEAKREKARLKEEQHGQKEEEKARGGHDGNVRGSGENERNHRVNLQGNVGGVRRENGYKEVQNYDRSN